MQHKLIYKVEDALISRDLDHCLVFKCYPFGVEDALIHQDWDHCLVFECYLSVYDLPHWNFTIMCDNLRILLFASDSWLAFLCNTIVFMSGWDIPCSMHNPKKERKIRSKEKHWSFPAITTSKLLIASRNFKRFRNFASWV